MLNLQVINSTKHVNSKDFTDFNKIGFIEQINFNFIDVISAELIKFGLLILIVFIINYFQLVILIILVFYLLHLYFQFYICLLFASFYLSFSYYHFNCIFNHILNNLFLSFLFLNLLLLLFFLMPNLFYLQFLILVLKQFNRILFYFIKILNLEDSPHQRLY